MKVTMIPENFKSKNKNEEREGDRDIYWCCCRWNGLQKIEKKYCKKWKSEEGLRPFRHQNCQEVLEDSNMPWRHGEI